MVNAPQPARYEARRHPTEAGRFVLFDTFSQMPVQGSYDNWSAAVSAAGAHNRAYNQVGLDKQALAGERP